MLAVVGPVLGLLLATSFGSLVMADEVQCWAPDGTTLADNATVVPCNKLGIQQDGVHSSCCRLDGDAEQRDLCTTTGLCLSTFDGAIRREFCTDKTWNSPACVNVCTDPKNGGSLNGSTEMTACADGTGTYCCGRNQLGCCGTDRAIVIPTQASVVANNNTNTNTSSPNGGAFKSATIALAVILAVVALAGAGAVVWLLRKNKAIKKQLSEKLINDSRHVPPPVAIHPYEDNNSYNAGSTPQFKSSIISGSPSPAYEMNHNVQRYSELDGSMAPPRSEMGSPVYPQYENGLNSPRSMHSGLRSPHLGS